MKKVEPPPASAASSEARASGAGGMADAVLNALLRAGTDGLTANQLASGRRGRALIERTLAGLAAEGKVRSFTAGRRTIYLLNQLAPSVESVRERLQQLAGASAGILISRDDFAADLAPAETPFLSQALGGLIAEKWLIKLSHKDPDGAGIDFFVLRDRLLGLTAEISTEGRKEDFRAKLIDVYREIVSRSGFPDVEIFELHERSGIPLASLKERLMEERNAGRAVLSFGDWSLASPQIRSGAVEIDGDRYLRVRFQTGDAS